MLESEIHIRDYRPEDSQALAHIYYHTIHQINSQHYSQEQVDVWAPKTSLDGEKWNKKFSKTKPIVAVADGQIVGFAEFEPDGHIDCFYCHHEWIGRGVGSALMNEILKRAIEQDISHIYAEVSITAKPFFESKGFNTVAQQTVTKDGAELINYKMEKLLDGSE